MKYTSSLRLPFLQALALHNIWCDNVAIEGENLLLIRSRLLSTMHQPLPVPHSCWRVETVEAVPLSKLPSELMRLAQELADEELEAKEDEQ